MDDSLVCTTQSFSSQPNAAQYADHSLQQQSLPEIDSSQTFAKQLLGADNATVNGHNGEDLNNSTLLTSPPHNNNWPLITKLQEHYVNLAENDFLTRVIVDANGREDRLEEMRDAAFASCKVLEGYPFPNQAPLKRRVTRTNSCENLVDKLASDIYKLVSVLEGAEFDTIKDVISLPKSKRCNSSIINSQNDGSTVTYDIALLKNALAQCQVDIVKLREEKEQSSKKFSDDIEKVKKDIIDVKRDVESKFSELNRDLEINSQTLSRLEDARFSNLNNLKVSVSSLSDELHSEKELNESRFLELRASVNNTQRKIEKYCGKVKSKLSVVDKSLQAIATECDRNYSPPRDVPLPSTSASNPIVVNDDQQSDNHTDIPQQLPLDLSAKSRDRNVDPVLADDRLYRDVVVVRANTHNTPTSVQSTVVTAPDHIASGAIDGSNCDKSNTRDVRHNNQQQQASSQGGYPRNADTVFRELSNHVNRNNRDRSNNTHRIDRTGNKVFNKAGSNQASRVNINANNHSSASDNGKHRSEPDPHKADDDSLFEGFTEHIVHKTKRFHLAGFKPSIKPDLIYKLVGRAKVKVTMMRIFPLRNSRSAIVRLNVENPNSHLLTEDGFWPEGVTCRPWVSRNMYQTMYAKNNNTNSNNYRDRNTAQFGSDRNVTYDNRGTRNEYRDHRSDYYYNTNNDGPYEEPNRGYTRDNKYTSYNEYWSQNTNSVDADSARRPETGYRRPDRRPIQQGTYSSSYQRSVHSR